MGDASNKAAARGMTVDPNLDDVPTTILHPFELETAWIAVADVSASLSPIGTCILWKLLLEFGSELDHPLPTNQYLVRVVERL